MNPIAYLTILFVGIMIFFLWYEIAINRAQRKVEAARLAEAERNITEMGRLIAEKKNEIAKQSAKEPPGRYVGRALRQTPLNSVSRKTHVEHHHSIEPDPLVTMLLFNAALNNSVNHDPAPSSDTHNQVPSSDTPDCEPSDPGPCDCDCGDGGSD